VSRVYFDYLQRLPEELGADERQLELNIEYLAAQSTTKKPPETGGPPGRKAFSKFFPPSLEQEEE